MSIDHIILDLDQTLIHSRNLKPDSRDDRFVVHQMDQDYWVHERPGVQQFLDFIFRDLKATVGVWTAASKSYALFVIQRVILREDRPERHLNFILHSTHCGESEEMCSGNPKWLDYIWSTFTDFTPKNTIIVDDNLDVFKDQECNTYLIPAFKTTTYSGDPNSDLGLMKLIERLSGHTGEPKHLQTKRGLDKAKIQNREEEDD